MRSRGTVKYRGINYDVGTEYRRGESSRPIWSRDDVMRDLRVVRHELHCTSVNLYGTDLQRLHEAAILAHEEGLHVSLQLRSIDESRDQMLGRLADAARVAEQLGRDGAVTLNVGCEMTLFVRGFVVGSTFRTRIRNLLWMLPLLPLINRRLNEHLRDAVRVARTAFAGPLTYSAGAWESVQWEAFDLVGVNLYRDRWNEKTYVSDLRRLRRFGKPVIVTEFGCSTFEGAERKGGGGWMIVDFDAVPPKVKPGHVRSEEVQARLLDELLGLYVAEGIDGAYVFDFMQATFFHAPQPERDLDMAGYGLVKVRPSERTDTSIAWEPKAAFDVVARHYARLADGERASKAGAGPTAARHPRVQAVL